MEIFENREFYNFALESVKTEKIAKNKPKPKHLEETKI